VSHSQITRRFTIFKSQPYWLSFKSTRYVQDPVSHLQSSYDESLNFYKIAIPVKVLGAKPSIQC